MGGVVDRIPVDGAYLRPEMLKATRLAAALLHMAMT